MKARSAAAGLLVLASLVLVAMVGGCSSTRRVQGGAAEPAASSANRSVPLRPKGVYDGKSFDTRPVDVICKEKGIEFREPRIVIDKSDYILTLYAGSIPVKTYKVLFGGNPVDGKKMEGDRSTPEGNYVVRDKYPHKQWKYFIWISYPDEQDEREYRELKQAGQLPSSAEIGGEVGIHGPLRDEWQTDGRNWTDGCVSMYRADLEELYEHVEVGTPIVITK
ncbi:MAG: L,D-transpeptidase [Actinomycetota bacterium]